MSNAAVHTFHVEFF